MPVPDPTDATDLPQRRRFQPLEEFLQKADLTPLQFLRLLLRGEAPRVVEIAGDLKVPSADAVAWVSRQEWRACASRRLANPSLADVAHG